MQRPVQVVVLVQVLAVEGPVEVLVLVQVLAVQGPVHGQPPPLVRRLQGLLLLGEGSIVYKNKL